MMKKQYFCILALCAFFGINVTHTSNAGEIQASQERIRQGKRKLSCQEKADRVRAKVLKQCQDHRAAKATRASVGGGQLERDRSGREKLSCQELANKVHAKVLARCQRHRAAKADAQARGTYRKGDKRMRGYDRGWGRSGHAHKQPGRQLYKQEQSMSPTAPSRRQMPAISQQDQLPYEANLINPASIPYQPEQSGSVRMPRGYGQPMQQQEMLAEPSAPVLPEPGLSDRETMLLMAPE